MASGSKDVNAYLSAKQSSAPKEIASEWALLEEYHTKKLVYYNLQLFLLIVSHTQYLNSIGCGIN